MWNRTIKGILTKKGISLDNPGSQLKSKEVPLRRHGLFAHLDIISKWTKTFSIRWITFLTEEIFSFITKDENLSGFLNKNSIDAPTIN